MRVKDGLVLRIEDISTRRWMHARCDKVDDPWKLVNYGSLMVRDLIFQVAHNLSLDVNRPANYEWMPPPAPGYGYQLTITQEDSVVLAAAYGELSYKPVEDTSGIAALLHATILYFKQNAPVRSGAY